jgi:endo-1,4-beta-xylanase
MKTHASAYSVSTSRCTTLLALGLVACAGGCNDASGNPEATAAGSGVGSGAISGTGGAVGVIGLGGTGGGVSTVGSSGAGGNGRIGVSGMGGAGTFGISGTGASGKIGVSGTGGAGRIGVSGTRGAGRIGISGTGGTGAASSSGSGGTGGASTGGTGGTVSCSGAPLSGGTPHCSSNSSGAAGSYSWSIWSSGSGGCITPYGVGAAFKATWNNSGDFLAREGFQWNETKTYDQLGTISADYAYTKTGSGGGYSYIGIYGWSNNPLIEFYIVDDWYGSGPPTAGGALKGSLSVDGGTYNIYTHTQTNQPSIHGTATFVQFFSIRQTSRQCGHISITEHFKKWASLGMTLGNMYEAKLLVEAGGGSGSIDFTTATMTAQ